MTSSHAFDGDELAWLHGLARALVASGESAEDLAQETALWAVELGRPSGAPARPWLASAMRGLRSNRRRSERRRAAREGLRGAPDPAPSTDELVARAETAEALAAAARALPEPQRRTVLLHFLEGLPVAEIARREGRPADTIRWRLRRGIELLRARLVERSAKDWEWWSAVLVPLARPPFPAASAAPAVAGSVLLAAAMKWSAALVAAVLALTLAWSPWRSSTPAGPREEGPSPAVGAPAARTPDAVALETPSSSPDAGLRAEASATAAPAARRPSSMLDGVVVDRAGAPIEGATVALLDGDRADAAERPDGIPRASSGPDGRFDLAGAVLPDDLATGLGSLSLRVAAGGYRRAVLPDAIRQRPEEGWRVVLERGSRLDGRVVDEDGRPVPGVELAAYRAGMRVDHMSLTRRRRRLHVASLVAPAGDDQCIATSGPGGGIRFEGLGDGEQRVLSLDPAWEVLGPRTALAGSGGIVWTVRPTFGVIVEVVDPDGALPEVSAVFRVEVTDASGASQDIGQWVGGGTGRASLALTADDLGVTPLTARFHGTVEVDGRSAEWSAAVLERLPAIARVEVGLSELQAPPPVAGAAAGEELPQRDVVLDVRRADGTFVESGHVHVRWRLAEGPRRGTVRARAGRGPGRFVASLPAADLSLEVTEAGAQGSIDPWTGRLAAGTEAPVAVTLAAGATLTVVRPPGLGGVWKLRVDRGDAPDGPWRGGWTYGTDERLHVLTAVDAGVWRLRVSGTDDFSEPVAVYVVEVAAGDDVTLGP